MLSATSRERVPSATCLVEPSGSLRVSMAILSEWNRQDAKSAKKSPGALGVLAVENQVYSPTYGKRPMKRARLTASLTARWNAAQLPLRLRLSIFPRGEQSIFRVLTSL